MSESTVAQTKKGLFSSLKDSVKSGLKKTGVLVDDPSETPKTSYDTTRSSAFGTAPAPVPGFSSSPAWPGPLTTPAPSTLTEDPHWEEVLNQKLAENSLQNTYDYFKLRKAVQLLQQKTHVDERTAFIQALISAETAGSTKEKIVDTATAYIAVLDGELRNFEKAMLEHNKDQIAADEQEITRLEASVSDHQARIAQLNQELTTLQTQKTAAVTKLAQRKSDLETDKSRFLLTYNRLKNGIQTDVAKLKETVTV